MPGSSPAIVKVLVPTAVDEAYDYLLPAGMDAPLGAYVRVPLGRREVLGMVWGHANTSDVPAAKLRGVLGVLPLPPVSEALRALVDKTAAYTLSPRGGVLRMVMSVEAAITDGKLPKPMKQRNTPAPLKPVSFSVQQQEAAEMLAGRVREAEYAPMLLDGVTGSGKTEVYFEAVRAAIEDGGQALVMLPEIALSAQWLARFESRFGTLPETWHSALTPAQRREAWKRIALGHSKVVVGARSALFLPYPALRVIVVDEEHEPAYKQEEGVVYHARDMAVLRASLERIPIILASATPSLESWVNAEQGRYQHIRLPERHGGAHYPDVKAIDLQRAPLSTGSWISDPLKEALRQNFGKGGQSLLFLNRRGFAPLTLCRKCGERLKCPHCDAWMVYHKARGRLICHQCGFERGLPTACPECKAEETLVQCGPGVERLEAEVRELFPEARVASMTSDTITTTAQAEALVNQMAGGEIDILLGTQMIAKGHHFPKLTLVGVVDADLGLAGGDLRASERTFQLLHQVAGRAGREEARGTAYIQTYYPKHPVLQAIARGDREAFYRYEIAARKEANMPPFSRLAALVISAPQPEVGQQVCKSLAAVMPYGDGVQVFGPAPAPLSVIRRRYRYRFLIQANRQLNLQKALAEWLGRVRVPSSVRIKVDIDPYSFL